MTPVLHLEQAEKALASGDGPVPVLRGVDLSKAPAETLALTGESGSGKTLTGKAVMRLQPNGAAVTGGTVARITNWNANWWEVGCGRSNPPADCHSCGIGITIQHPDGLRHTYCHNSRHHVTVGDQIAPGQHIADTGNTGRSGAPHLHLEFRIDGQRVCPQPLMIPLFEGSPVGQTSEAAAQDCSF